MSLQGVSQVLFDDVICHFPNPCELGLGVLIHSVKKLTCTEKKQWIALRYLIFFKICFLWYCTVMVWLINFSILPRSVVIFHVSLSIIYHLYDLILRLYILFLRWWFDSCIRSIKKGLVIETWLDLMFYFLSLYIILFILVLPSYFYLLYVATTFIQPKTICLIISIRYPN